MKKKLIDIIFLQSINPNDNVTCDLTSTSFEERHLAVEQIKWLKAVERGEIKSSEFNTPELIEKAIKEEKKNKERAELEIYKYIQYLKKRYDRIEFLGVDCNKILNKFFKNEVINNE